MLQNMDRIDLMKAYLAVADAGSFTGAATRMQSTPQLVSKYVRALEDEMGAQLFHRTTRKVSPTETGRALYARAQQIVEDFETLKTDLGQDRARPTGTLRLTAPTGIGMQRMAPLVSDFLSMYKEMEIDLHLSDRFVDLLDEGFDLAIRIGALQDSTLVARKLAPSSVLLCASPAYLAENGTPTHPRDLDGHRCIIDTNFRAGAIWRFQDGNQTLRIRAQGPLRVNSASIVHNLLLRDQGIGMVPSFQVQADVNAGKLVSLLPGFLQSDINIYAVYPPNRHLSAKTRAFVDFLADRLQHELPTPAD